MKMDEQNSGTQRFSAQSFESAEGGEQIKRVPPDQVRAFQGHTFQVRDDPGMKKLLESVKTHGILEPALAFYNEDGELELISGHRRQRVAQELGLEVMPVLIRDVSREEATVLMGETNLMQREKILPSEKAFTYKAMLEAIRKMPGQAGEATNGEEKERSRDILAKRIGESASQIVRYVRLTRLIPELLSLVDAGKIRIRPALELTYLPESYQQAVYEHCRSMGVMPLQEQAHRLREMYEEKQLTAKDVREIFEESKSEEAVKEQRLVFQSEILLSMLSGCGSIAEREERIILGLKLLAAKEAGKIIEKDEGKEAIETAPVEGAPIQAAANPDQTTQDNQSEMVNEISQEQGVQPDPVQQNLQGQGFPEQQGPHYGYPAEAGQEMPQIQGYPGYAGRPEDYSAYEWR